MLSSERQQDIGKVVTKIIDAVRGKRSGKKNQCGSTLLLVFLGLFIASLTVLFTLILSSVCPSKKMQKHLHLPFQSWNKKKESHIFKQQSSVLCFIFHFILCKVT